jgi:outer membrane protein W
MKGSIFFVAIAAAAAAQPALAQQSDVGIVEPHSEAAGVSTAPVRRTIDAPSSAWEFGLGAGYSQGVGDIGGSSPTLTDLSHAGAEIQLNVGYRINPNWMVGVYGSGGKYNKGNLVSADGDVYSATAGVQANYHLLPDQQWDPWIGLGAGWRGHWISQAAGTDSRHGLDVARLQVGVDYRVNSQFSIAPYVGASATVFLTQKLAQQGSFNDVSDPNVNFFFAGGFLGRFDVL